MVLNEFQVGVVRLFEKDDEHIAYCFVPEFYRFSFESWSKNVNNKVMTYKDFTSEYTIKGSWKSCCVRAKRLK